MGFAMLFAVLVASRRLAGFTWLLEVTAALSEMAPWRSLHFLRAPAPCGPVFHYVFKHKHVSREYP